MKNKSVRHKEANTFKFQSFSERISNINIDVFHRVAHEYEAEDEDACFFYQAIQKWNVLNLTECYSDFRKELNAHSYVTLSQLIHNKDQIVEVLLNHLKHKNPLCLQPLLELVVALAQDLRKDFYRFYSEFLDVLIELLETKNSEQLEWTFTCLAYVFKFLWRTLIKEVSCVFKKLLPLLSDNKPPYINDFAAASFSFVARKVKDQHGFLKLILKSVNRNRDGIRGCGKLLFEIVRGVNGQFHSCADGMISAYFDLVDDDSLPQDLLSEILKEFIQIVITNIHPDKNQLFWQIIIVKIDDSLLKWSANHAENVSSNLDFILQCVGQALNYKSGRFLSQATVFIEKILELLTINDLQEVVLMTVVKIVILLLSSRNVKLQQEQVSALIKKVMSLPSKRILLYFVENSCTASSFEALILPLFLKLCVKCRLDDECLLVLANVISHKMPSCKSGIELDEWKKYSINFGSEHDHLEMERVLCGYIEVEKPEQIIENPERYLYSLICIPHVKLQDVFNLEKILVRNIKQLCSDIKCDTSVLIKLFVILNTLECAVHIVGTSTLASIKNDVIDGLLHLCNNVTYICSLRILDLFLSAMRRGEVISREVLLRIHAVLEENFNSPYHEMRLLTSHIYSVFEESPDFKIPDSLDEWNIFSICYKIESIEPQVHTYREQILLLEKLNFDKPQITLCKSTEFSTVPLRYLCGVLYMNFKLLWEPVINIISTYAVGLDTNLFWSIYSGELKGVVERIKTKGSNDVTIEANSFGSSCLNTSYQTVYNVRCKPDFETYRLLLWKAMCLFPEVAEAKTRDTAEIFLNFIDNEYSKSKANISTWNIKENNPEEIKSNDIKEDGKKEKSTNLKALTQHVALFAKIRSPKSMYREPELLKLYLDLLSHKNHGVQKLALDCIMMYKFKYLTPYSTSLYNLIDDKAFKNELTTFRIDKESAVVQEEHRKDLIPIVLKIVFSKMVVKTGLRTGGKSSGQLRRNLVFRFLAGCHEDEMIAFIKMAFRYYNSYLQPNPELMAEMVYCNVNLENFIPPKKLQSSLNMLNVILDEFGGLMGDELLKYLIQILLVVGSFLKAAAYQHTDVHNGYHMILRNLRTSSIKLMGDIFKQFEKYPWTSQEINAVFDVFIWTYLDKLNVEGIHSPTALLKLLVTWGMNPRYFPLLVKHKANDKSQHPLPYIMRLLVNDKAQVTVVNLIMEMAEKMLTLQPNEEDLELRIPVENELQINDDILQRLTLSENLNYGSCILLPHATVILERIRWKLQSKAKNLNQRYLFVLSRISELVWESDVSDVILRLLFPIVLKKCAQNSSEEVILQLVSSLHNLMKNIKEPRKHLKQLSPLFGEVNYPSSRKLLCQVLDLISKVHEEFKPTASTVHELNSFDSKWVDQPDFQKRTDAFRSIQNSILNDTVPLELGVMIIYNCHYTIRNEKDLSLRENASHCLRTLCPTLIKKYTKDTERNYILDETLLNLIRLGLRNKNSDVRNELISLLGYLSRECSEHHIILKDLSKLTNKTDIEVDFFENMVHMQTHRQVRALLKFCGVFKEALTQPNIRTLTHFILPLASYYLCNDRYTNKNTIVDAALEAVGVICKLLPWHHYESLLKFYLGKLQYKIEYQKQLVRLIVIILDAFHFDLSKGDVTKSTLENHEGEKQVDEVIEVNDVALDDLLSNNVEEENEEGDEAKESVLQPVKPFEKITVLCKSTANRVTRTIQRILLPQLHRALAELTHHESKHKVNRKKTSIEREEEDLLRVPISLAIVKLLQKLPKEILDANLRGVFMKLCSFLKSQLESVRRVARETLQKIMITLGPKYLSILLDEMVPLLSKGFQVHVLVHTVHAVLVHLKEFYKPGDIDNILLTVIKLCKADLFGSLSDEREVAKIVAKVSEAKSTKSFDTFQILAQFITDGCLTDLVVPIKDVLSTSHSYKNIHKAQDCLRHIALGLVDNTFIPPESLLKFSYGSASESIRELSISTEQPVLTEKEREKTKREKPDCFIIPSEPVYRSGHRVSNVKTSTKTNAHILVEFGLKLCYFLLKRDKLNEAKHKPFVDPFVAIFKNCLKSKHIKLSTVTLQCLGWVMKYDLPSMREHIKDITESLFDILHKYAAAGLSKGDNFDLVVAAFKTMAVLVRDVKYYVIEKKQLKMLLLYVEQDLHDYDRQATAFALLKAILSRKLIVPEIQDIMRKVAELSITSELTHVRLQSRLVFHQFIMDYPLGKKLDKHISFYTSQLNYEMQSGRESALEMIQTFINTFPIHILKEFSATFLIALGARLVNDEIPQCKKMASDCINSMFTRLPRQDRDSLFDIIILWLKENKVNHRQLAAQLCGILVTVEKSDFESRLRTLTPTLLLQFGLNTDEHKPGRFVLLNQETSTDHNTDESDRVKDHHIFQVLQLLLKLSAHCPVFLKQSSDVENITLHVQGLLGHPHEWVRIGAAQFIGFVLSSLSTEYLAELLTSNEHEESGYLYSDPANGIKSLTLDLCAQLQPNSVKPELAEQVVKNLVFIARVLQEIPLTGNEMKQKIDLIWLIKRMRKVINTEVVEAPTSTTLRTEVFKWIGGIGTALKLEKVEAVLHLLLVPLVREMMTTEEGNVSLRHLSKEVGHLLKRRIGVDTYTNVLSKLQQHLLVKRAERKRTRTQLAVTDPEVYAKKKIKHHEKKKEAKKRKLNQRKGEFKKAKRRKVDLEDNSEIM